VSFILQGLGIGFVMSPMSTAAMNAVDRTRAGVASGILNMTRMVGSTFGVAALGAIIATIGRSELATRLPHVPAAQRAKLVDVLGSGASTTHLPAHVQGALNDTYVYALTKGLYAIGTLALVGSLLAWMLIGRSAAFAAPLAEAQTADSAHASAPAIEGSATAAAADTVVA
jgi:hypothetical protein